jgi:ornithine carbamoyltransferase
MMHAVATTPPLADFLSLAAVTPDTLRGLLADAAYLKRSRHLAEAPLRGRSAALLFEKPSLRTRTTFELGMYQLGGHAVYLSKEEINLGVRESIADAAHSLERWFDVLVIRTSAHARVLELAEHAAVPVINALSDAEHPCQALADMMTLEEHLGSLHGATLAYIGDGNNVSHSLLHAAAALGMHLRVATPEAYAPSAVIVAQAQRFAVQSGASITVTNDPLAAVEGAQAVYTDTWISMGQEREHSDRLAAFAGFQVNSALMRRAAPGAVFLHCLPAHRGEEVTDDVIDGPCSVVFDQAENRLHTQKALLMNLLGS